MASSLNSLVRSQRWVALKSSRNYNYASSIVVLVSQQAHQLAVKHTCFFQLRAAFSRSCYTPKYSLHAADIFPAPSCRSCLTARMLHTLPVLLYEPQDGLLELAGLTTATSNWRTWRRTRGVNKCYIEYSNSHPTC